MQCRAPSREILVEAQISNSLAFHFSLPGKSLLAVQEGNFEPAETGTWLPKDFLGYANVSGFSLVSSDFLRIMFRFLLWISLWSNWVFQCMVYSGLAGVAQLLIWSFMLFTEIINNDWVLHPTAGQPLFSRCYSSTSREGPQTIWRSSKQAT